MYGRTWVGSTRVGHQGCVCVRGAGASWGTLRSKAQWLGPGAAECGECRQRKRHEVQPGLCCLLSSLASSYTSCGMRWSILRAGHMQMGIVLFICKTTLAPQGSGDSSLCGQSILSLWAYWPETPNNNGKAAGWRPLNSRGYGASVSRRRGLRGTRTLEAPELKLPFVLSGA